MKKRLLWGGVTLLAIFALVIILMNVGEKERNDFLSGFLHENPKIATPQQNSNLSDSNEQRIKEIIKERDEQKIAYNARLNRRANLITSVNIFCETKLEKYECENALDVLAGDQKIVDSLKKLSEAGIEIAVINDNTYTYLRHNQLIISYPMISKTNRDELKKYLGLKQNDG